MDHFLKYIANDTEQNTNDILDEMVSDNNSFEELRNIINEPGITNISTSSNGTITSETGTSNSDVVMETTSSGTSSEKEGVTYPETTSNTATSGKPWTKNKRDTSGSYVENIDRKRTTFSRKIKLYIRRQKWLLNKLVLKSKL